MSTGGGGYVKLNAFPPGLNVFRRGEEGRQDVTALFSISPCGFKPRVCNKELSSETASERSPVP